MLSLEEAISHCLEVAEREENKAKMIENNFSSLRREQKQEVKSCRECGTEHRQLAEWLRELKALRESRSLQWWLKQCDTCRYRSCQPEQKPCNRCCHNYKNKWEYDETREQNSEEVKADE